MHMIFTRDIRCAYIMVIANVDVLYFVSSQGEQPKPSSAVKLGSEAIQFSLNEEQGYYEIGPQQQDNQIFVLAVTIGLASNLAKVGLCRDLF